MLISHFVARLKAHGVANPPSFDEAWFLYRCTCFYPVVTWLNNSGVWQPEAINTANVVRAASAAVEHDSMGLLGI
jgi:exoribonuclease II